MTGPRQLWTAWVELLSRKESGESLALMRILAGLTVLIILGTMVRHDLIGLLYYDQAYGGYLRNGEPTWLVRALGGPTPQVVWGLVISAAVAGVALVLGVGARAAALIAGQCLLALRGINPLAGSYNSLISNALWLLVLARSDLTLSLACRLRRGSWTSDEQVPSWPRLLGIVQLVILYAWTGLTKVSAHWVGDFSALYYILQDPNWQRFDMPRIVVLYPLLQVMSALVWLWEISFAILLLAAWYRETADRPGRVRAWFNRHDLRVPYALVGIGTHLTIHATMVVGPFLFATLTFYPCLFPPQRWRQWFTRLREPAKARI